MNYLRVRTVAMAVAGCQFRRRRAHSARAVPRTLPWVLIYRTPLIQLSCANNQATESALFLNAF